MPLLYGKATVVPSFKLKLENILRLSVDPAQTVQSWPCILVAHRSIRSPEQTQFSQSGRYQTVFTVLDDLRHVGIPIFYLRWHSVISRRVGKHFTR